MKKLITTTVLAAAIIGAGATGAWATPTLFDWAFNIDGAVSEDSSGDPFPVSGNGTTFDDLTGLGTLNWSTNVVGAHSFLAFFDHDIDEAINTFYNEYGSTTGTLAAGQSWEIDEPGYFFGDIYDNLLAGSLDNGNGVPIGQEEDVSMAMGWDFTLAAGETADISLTLSNTMPTSSGFFLTHWDPDSNSGFYFSSDFTITGGSGGPDPIPEPATMLLFGTGLAGLWAANRRKKKLNKE